MQTSKRHLRSTRLAVEATEKMPSPKKHWTEEPPGDPTSMLCRPGAFPATAPEPPARVCSGSVGAWSHGMGQPWAPQGDTYAHRGCEGPRLLAVRSRASLRFGRSDLPSYEIGSVPKVRRGSLLMPVARHVTVNADLGKKHEFRTKGGICLSGGLPPSTPSPLPPPPNSVNRGK